jgi:hypothetical protein
MIKIFLKYDFYVVLLYFRVAEKYAEQNAWNTTLLVLLTLVALCVRYRFFF